MIRKKFHFIILLTSFLFFGVIAGTMTSGDSQSVGPDYELLNAVLPMSETITWPGTMIHPVLTIKNTGLNSSEMTSFNISGRLGNTSLTPVSAKVPVISAGEKKVITLTFQVPDTIDYGGYVLYFELDPDRQTPDINTENNVGKAGGVVSITLPDDEEFIGCEACWKGYR